MAKSTGSIKTAFDLLTDCAKSKQKIYLTFDLGDITLSVEKFSMINDIPEAVHLDFCVRDTVSWADFILLRVSDISTKTNNKYCKSHMSDAARSFVDPKDIVNLAYNCEHYVHNSYDFDVNDDLYVLAETYYAIDSIIAYKYRVGKLSIGSSSNTELPEFTFTEVKYEDIYGISPYHRFDE